MLTGKDSQLGPKHKRVFQKSHSPCCSKNIKNKFPKAKSSPVVLIRAILSSRGHVATSGDTLWMGRNQGCCYTSYNAHPPLQRLMWPKSPHQPIPPQDCGLSEQKASSSTQAGRLCHDGAILFPLCQEVRPVPQAPRSLPPALGL